MDDPKPTPETARMSNMAMLWAKAQPSVLAFVRVSVRNQHDCEDVLQATVQYIVEHFDEYDPERPFIAWAIGIARYRVMDFQHRQAHDSRLLSDTSLRQVAVGFAQVPEIDIDARRDALDYCLENLPKKNWEVVYQRYYEGASITSIAEQLDAKPNSISVMLRRVRIALSKCIELRLKIGGDA